ncbi:hypothetical protein DFJ63DRAFT_315816 [Scheffersomyces coipomensis]|uniref:uncharacterized protein n=1 Tax=Scheffersomyces coipomensis TaxID=1788519 RepID=UPI00315C5CCC
MSLSIESLLEENQLELESIDTELNNSFITISKHSLLADKQLVQNFMNKVDHENSTSIPVSLSQLNQQYEEIESNLHDLHQLQFHYNQYQDINSLILKSSQLNILDFHHLFTLFDKYHKQPQPSEEDVILIYKVIHKSIDQLYERFVQILNDYLLSFIPNEFNIENINGLHEFNKLLVNNHIKLDNYTTYRNKWDQLIESVLSSKSNHEVELIDENLDIDFISIKVTSGSSSGNFIKSISNVMTFINYINNESIKQYLNSKINKLLINKIAININNIVNDEMLLSGLNELIALNKSSSGWNIFIGAFNDPQANLQQNLTKLYNDWLIDQYIDKLRHVFKDHHLISSLESVPESGSEPTTSSTKTDDDGWNDDGWNNDDDDDGWDDEDVLKDEPKEESTNTFKISKLSQQVIQLIKQFQNDSSNSDIKYLITTIKSLSLIKYQSIDKSLLIYNDLKYISQQLNSTELDSFIESVWNKNLLDIYERLRLLLLSLILGTGGDLELEPIQDEGELDDESLQKLSSIYGIFNNHFNDSDYQHINPIKTDSLMIEIIQFINDYLILMVLSLEDIGEFQSIKISHIIDSINNITIPFLKPSQKDEIKSYNRLQNFKFLIKNHLKDILDRFNEGEFFDLSTDELIIMIKKLFMQSKLRDDCINEIIEFRNLT